MSAPRDERVAELEAQIAILEQRARAQSAELSRLDEVGHQRNGMKRELLALREAAERHADEVSVLQAALAMTRSSREYNRRRYLQSNRARALPRHLRGRRWLAQHGPDARLFGTERHARDWIDDRVRPRRRTRQYLNAAIVNLTTGRAWHGRLQLGGRREGRIAWSRP